MSHFSIEKFNYEKDWGNLLEFFKEVYSPNHILTNKIFFEWQFIKSGFKNWFVKRNDEAVGHVGIIDPPFIVRGKERRVGFWVCLIVLEELKNHGLGVFLSREIEKEMDAVYSTGINEDGMKLFRGLKWTDCRNLYRWINISPFPKCEPRASEIKKFDEMWDASWKTLQKRYPATADRMSEYLNWRFIYHPKIDYKIFGIKDKDEFDGYIILRLEESEVRAVRIVDFIAKEEKTEIELLKAALNYAHEKQAAFIDFFCSSKIYEKSLEKLGFADPESEVVVKTPIFILPLDTARTHITWAYKIIDPALKNLTKEDWFIVKADGDKDRPQ